LTLQNPINIHRFAKLDDVCFAGAWYPRHEERHFDAQKLLEAAADYALSIYDRNLDKPWHADYEFPEPFRKYIRGSLPFDEMLERYRQSAASHLEDLAVGVPATGASIPARLRPRAGLLLRAPRWAAWAMTSAHAEVKLDASAPAQNGEGAGTSGAGGPLQALLDVIDRAYRPVTGALHHVADAQTDATPATRDAPYLQPLGGHTGAEMRLELPI
jgi:hypothetical protein